MFHEVFVVVHGNSALLATLLFIHKSACALCRNSAYVDSMSGLLSVHSLAYYNDVGGYLCTAKGLVMETESTDHICTAFTDEPVAKLLTVVKCAV